MGGEVSYPLDAASDRPGDGHASRTRAVLPQHGTVYAARVDREAGEVRLLSAPLGPDGEPAEDLRPVDEFAVGADVAAQLPAVDAALGTAFADHHRGPTGDTAARFTRE